MDFDLNAKFSVEELAPGLWRFNENMGGNGVDAYLVAGEKRAALIDALQSNSRKASSNRSGKLPTSLSMCSSRTGIPTTPAMK